MARPTTEIHIKDLIDELNELHNEGKTKINLSGKGTLHCEGNCIMTTEDQM